MAICRFDIDNFEYNIESNLEAMGLPLPKTLFGSATTVSAAIASIETALATKAADIPLSAITSAAIKSKKATGLFAAYWAGAVIGSALMASNRATRCSYSEFKDAFKSLGFPSWAADEALKGPNGDKLLQKN